MKLETLNSSPRADVIATLRPCVDIERWCSELADGRPFESIDELVRAAERSADPFTHDEIEAALAHHPRIGERASGDHAEATLSRAEQAGVDPSDEPVQTALRDGNLAYEEKFGRVFLIRAAGRSAGEILENLQERLTNDAEDEDQIVAGQLREIAIVRLKGMVTE